MIVYGEAPTPGAPGTWDRELWRALHTAGRPRYFGRGLPIRYGRYTVTSGAPNRPYGRGTHGHAYLTHVPRRLLFAWAGGRLRGRMVAWHCGARTAYFRLSDEPTSPLCPMCLARINQQQNGEARA